MPRFEPFAGLRYNLDRVRIDEVTAPPYDVVDDEERVRLAQKHPDNVVHVDLPRSEAGDPYAGAAVVLERWREQGILVDEAQPTFYVYRMDFTDEVGRHRHTTGIIGALELSTPGEGDILPHEHTTPKAKSDRLDLLRATGVQLSPIWGLSPAAGLGELCDLGRPPLATWSDEQGVTHSLWLEDDEARQREISALVGSAPIVIADGHHRFETSLAYRDEQRAARGPGRYDLAMTLVVELVDDELTVLPIHRLLTGLPSGYDLLAALQEYFHPSAVESVDHAIVERMVAVGSLALVTREGSWTLEPRAEMLAGARDLDSSRLDVALAALPPHDVVYQHGVDHVVARVAKGEADAGVLLRPATVDQIVDIANGGERMPPKTTFFHPKPRTGVVLRPVT